MNYALLIFSPWADNSQLIVSEKLSVLRWTIVMVSVILHWLIFHFCCYCHCRVTNMWLRKNVIIFNIPVLSLFLVFLIVTVLSKLLVIVLYLTNFIINSKVMWLVCVFFKPYCFKFAMLQVHAIFYFYLLVVVLYSSQLPKLLTYTTASNAKWLTSNSFLLVSARLAANTSHLTCLDVRVVQLVKHW